MAKNSFELAAFARFVRVLGKRVVVTMLSIGLFLAGCGYNPVVRQYDEIPNFVTESEEFLSASSELALQGIAIEATLAAEDGAIVLGTSEPGVAVSILFLQGEVISVTIFKLSDGMLTVRNPSSDLETTVSVSELAMLTEEVMVTEPLEAPIVYGTQFHELARTLGFGIETFDAPQELLEAQCAACQAERNARNAAAASLVLATAGYALAVAGLATCGAIVTAPACLAALAAYSIAKASLALASAQWALAQSALDRCLRERC
jgi:hypothetical protein